MRTLTLSKVFSFERTDTDNSNCSYKTLLIQARQKQGENQHFQCWHLKLKLDFEKQDKKDLILVQVFIFERTLSGHLRRVDCYPQRFCFLKATQGCQDRARDNIVALFRFDFCSVTMDAEPGGGIEVELGLVVSQCRVQQFRCYIPEPFSPPGPVQSSLTSPACQMGLLVHKDSVDVYVVKVPLGPMLCPNSKTP